MNFRFRLGSHQNISYVYTNIPKSKKKKKSEIKILLVPSILPKGNSICISENLSGKLEVWLRK
jgi:hypothetical protein